MTDRENLEKVAGMWRESEALRRAQRTLQATLIRACVRAITKFHSPVLFPDHRSRAQIKEDYERALIQLDWLATKLEDEGTSKPDLP